MPKFIVKDAQTSFINFSSRFGKKLLRDTYEYLHLMTAFLCFFAGLKKIHSPQRIQKDFSLLIF